MPNTQSTLPSCRSTSITWFRPRLSGAFVALLLACMVSVIGSQKVGADDWTTIRDEVCSYEWDCEHALGVVYGNRNCPHGESSGNVLARNGRYFGLFQVDSYTHPYTFGFAPDDLFDVRVNVWIAYNLWLEGGWKPWPVCGRGRRSR